MKRTLPPPVAILITVIVIAAGSTRLFGRTSPPEAQAAQQVDVDVSVHHDVSPPLRDIPSAPRARHLTERPLRPLPGEQAAAPVTDPVVQSSAPLVSLAGAGLNFAGVGNGDYGFVPNAAPPDTNGAVGATQYVQWVNESFAVFDKATGAILKGPVAGNTLWAGFGGGCETNNDGDPIVQYDKLANVWVFTQFSVSTTPYLQCVAVSTTSDATGSYHRYAFSYGNQFPDYPKLGVWPDAYYVSYNIFTNGQTFAGPKVCAWDRTAMLAGAATVTQVCFQLGTNVNSLLPSDLDGTTPPLAGAPNVLARISTSALQLWRFHTDFVTPTNSTLTGPDSITVASYTRACNGGTCIPQAATQQQLDSLADRAMYRFAYRNLGGTLDSWVLNHSVATTVVKRQASGSGIRWYELHATAPGAVPTLFQQGTYAPDGDFRWMGSIAQDKAGNIIVGYSASSSKIHPAIRVASRLATDPPGTLSAETSAIEGTGSQLRNLSRWGDYSAMSVDPVDDCTFYYTNEYLKANGTFNWSTRIASYKMPGCS
jgi:hypothetical protein